MKAAEVWQRHLVRARPLRLPDATLQRAVDASLRQLLAMIEPRGKHVRVLKGLEHYYGANPYDTFQASRALDAVGLTEEARSLLRHKMAHLKNDGLFETWETGDLARPGAEQWIVQGLAAAALWKHYDRSQDSAWLKEISPTLIKAARATLRLRSNHTGMHRQGSADIQGWLPPIGGDGGLGVGYHWSQNAGPLAGVRIAAEAARRLGQPEAKELQAGLRDFQKSFDEVRRRAVEVSGARGIPAMPGSPDMRPLWGVVMSVTTFEAIPYDAPAAAVRAPRYAGMRRSSRAGILHHGAAVRLTSRDDRRSGIRFTRTIRLLSARSGVDIEATMTNVDDKPRRWGIWAHTQLDAADPDGRGPNRQMKAWCPLNPRSLFPKGYAVIFGSADNPSFQVDAVGRMMKVGYDYRVGKIGLDSDAGWVATVDGRTGAAFIQRFVFERGTEYPDGSSVEFWHNGTGTIHAYGKDLPQPNDPQENPYVFESEILSPFAKLQPGQSYTCTVPITGRRSAVGRPHRPLGLHHLGRMAITRAGCR